jgi:hypothetical protein
MKPQAPPKFYMTLTYRSNSKVIEAISLWARKGAAVACGIGGRLEVLHVYQI